jgi:hypothetical protein
MRTALLTLTFAILVPAAIPAEKKQSREPHPFAPSLPQLTDEEEAAIDRTIDRFILFDIGRLPGAAGQQALADFQKLGPEAIPGLIRGLNRAAKIDASCPAMTIGKKLYDLLKASKDTKLFDFARENIGAGVTRTRHGAVLNDLKVLCMVRKRAVTKELASNRPKKPKTPRSMSVAELADAVTTEQGPRLKLLLTELAGRKGPEVIDALASAAATRDEETGPLGQKLLVRHLSRVTTKALKEKLKDERAEVRLAAVQVVAAKRLRLGSELIDLLDDASTEIRDAAHDALVKLKGGTDFGPKSDTSDSERTEAIQKWRAWWKRQSGR